MKIFKFLAIALVAMLGFTACDKDCDHEFIDYDHSADIVGTWTCLQANFAEALVIKADGSALSTGYDGEEYWENMAGNIVVKNGMVTLTFEDGDNFEGHFDIIPKSTDKVAKYFGISKYTLYSYIDANKQQEEKKK